MTPNPQRVREIFVAAVRRPAAEWDAFLAEACGGDDDLRRATRELLDSHLAAGSFLDRPAVALGETAAIEPRDLASGPSAVAEPGTVLAGRYRLLEQVGEGGMGTVWSAEQTEPVKRLVAVKLIKPGMDSQQVLARFNAERQALALMDHPNIAKVFDGGVVPSGLPYFVMEFVRGVPITKYCDEHQLTPRQRLELFLPVCHAIQHAHQKGIIHRDIKPSNILVARVDDRAMPKVIDFGVAKSVGHPLTDRSFATRLGAVVGTVEYMSPEQADVNPLDVDTRSDVYSLGVLLYELLVGSPPFSRKELEAAGVLELLRVIREKEPSRPSTRLSSSDGLPALAANRGTEPARLTRLIRGELDWIVMKALEKDRSRRYESANSLAMDLQRYLADEPVEAGPPSAWYRLRKFVRRNRTAVAGAALVLLVLVVLGGVAGWLVRDRETRRARLAGGLEVILDDVARHAAEQRWPEALTAARRAESLVAGGGGDPELEQRVRQVFADLNLVQKLDEIMMERQAVAYTDRQLLRADQAYAAAFRDAGIDIDNLSPEEAVERLRSRSRVSVALAMALDDWSLVRTSLKNADGARVVGAIAERTDPDPWRCRVREAWRLGDGPALEELAASPELRHQPPPTLFMLARSLHRPGKGELAIAVLRQAQARYPDNFWVNYDLGRSLEYWRTVDPGRQMEALGCFRAALALRPTSQGALYRVTDVLYKLRRWDELLVHYRKGVELYPNHPPFHDGLARALHQKGDLDEAVVSYWRFLELDPTYASIHRSLYAAIRDQKNRARTIQMLRAAVAANPQSDHAHYYLGVALWLEYDSGSTSERNVRLREALALWNTSLKINENHSLTHAVLAWHLATASDPELRDHEAAYRHARAALQGSSNLDRWSHLGVAALRVGAYKSAVENLEKADRTRKGGDDYHRFFLAMAYWRAGEKGKAVDAYRQAVAWMEKKYPNNDNDEQRRFRTEAEEVLGINKK